MWAEKNIAPNVLYTVYIVRTNSNIINTRMNGRMISL